MLKKLTRQQMEQWAIVGLQQAINKHMEELARLEAIASSMDGKTSKPAKPARGEPVKRRTISAKHRAILAQAMRKRWREAKKAGAKRLG